MANTRSALKAWRQSIKRRLRNRSQRQAVRTQFRKAQASLTTGDMDASSAAIKAAVSSIDKAAEKGIVHPNNAARHKSRLMKKYNIAVAQAKAAAETAEKALARPARQRRRRET